MNTTTDDRPASTTPPQTPPGPSRRWWGLPLLRAMRRDYLGFTSGLQRQYGDVTFMRLGNERAIDLFDPELVRRLLVDHAQHLVRWERGIDVFEQVFGQSVLVTEGATWQRQRRMLQPAFAPRHRRCEPQNSAPPCGEPDPRNPSGPAVTDRSKQAGYMTAPRPCADPAKSPCHTGAIHT